MSHARVSSPSVDSESAAAISAVLDSNSVKAPAPPGPAAAQAVEGALSQAEFDEALGQGPRQAHVSVV